MDRFGPSILVEAGDENFNLILVATRYGASRKSQSGGKMLIFYPSPTDHVVGCPDVWVTGWLVGAGRNRPLEVWATMNCQYGAAPSTSV
jgi:ribonuclease Z